MVLGYGPNIMTNPILSCTGSYYKDISSFTEHFLCARHGAKCISVQRAGRRRSDWPLVWGEVCSEGRLGINLSCKHGQESWASKREIWGTGWG